MTTTIISTGSPSPRPGPPSRHELRDAFDQKVRRGIFAPVARHLPEDVREDRLQEAIGLTWAMYLRYGERGELLSDAILVHSCGLRATDPSRYLAQTDGCRKGDVFDARSFLDGHVELLHFSDCVAEEVPRRYHDGEASVGFGFAEATSSDPRRKLVSAHDLTTFVERLPVEDQDLLALRAEGHTLGEIGHELGLTTSGVFGRLPRLGRTLAERAGISVEGLASGVDAKPPPRRRTRAVKRRPYKVDRRTASCRV